MSEKRKYEDKIKQLLETEKQINAAFNSRHVTPTVSFIMSEI